MKRFVVSVFLMPALILTLTVFISYSASSQDETITLTTYYPSPHGVYRELRVQGGQLIIESDQVPQLTMASEAAPTGNASIDMGNVTLRAQAADDSLRVSGSLHTEGSLHAAGSLYVVDTLHGEGIGTTRYLKIYRDKGGDEPPYPLPKGWEIIPPK